MWSNPTICSENCRNNKKVEKRKNGDKGDKKSSQMRVICGWLLKTSKDHGLPTPSLFPSDLLLWTQAGEEL
jgi:hypothetical protein